MHLGKEKLKELKSKKIRIKNLKFQYSINSKNKIEVKNILNLLNEHVCDFKEIVDNFKVLHEFCNFLEDKELTEKLLENNYFSAENLKHLLNALCRFYELASLCDNFLLVKSILNEFILVDKKTVDKFNELAKKEMSLWHFVDEKVYDVFGYIEYRTTHY